MRILVLAGGASGESLEARLRAGGHTVDTARCRVEAVEMARAGRYDVYFVESETAGADTIEIINAIRSVEPEASVIVASRGPAMSVEDFVSMAQEVLPESRERRLPSLEAMEKWLIAATLEHTGGNIRESAAILGVDRSTVYEKIRKYQIPRRKAGSRKRGQNEPGEP
jgi:DNA-binding NtrC family response regulator